MNQLVNQLVTVLVVGLLGSAGLLAAVETTAVEVPPSAEVAKKPGMFVDWQVLYVHPEKVRRGDRVTVTWTGVNRSGKYLQISGVDAGCSCTKVAIGSTQLSPGDSCTISATIDLPIARVDEVYSGVVTVDWAQSERHEYLSYRIPIDLQGSAKLPEASEDLPAAYRRRLAEASDSPSTGKPLTALIGQQATGGSHEERLRFTPPTGSDPRYQPQRLCPFRNEAILKKYYMFHDGKKIYTCCEPCLGLLDRHPLLALKNLASRHRQRTMTEAEWQAWEATQPDAPADDPDKAAAEAAARAE